MSVGPPEKRGNPSLLPEVKDVFPPGNNNSISLDPKALDPPKPTNPLYVSVPTKPADPSPKPATNPHYVDLSGAEQAGE